MPSRVHAGVSHHIRYAGGGSYEISWSYEIKYKGQRPRYHRRIARITNTKGALRFAKKWGCKMPGVQLKEQP